MAGHNSHQYEEKSSATAAQAKTPWGFLWIIMKACLFPYKHSGSRTQYCPTQPNNTTQ